VRGDEEQGKVGERGVEEELGRGELRRRAVVLHHHLRGEKTEERRKGAISTDKEKRTNGL
jgi:hypothetical protein